MKNKLITLLIVGALSLTGCAHIESVNDTSDASMFVVIEETSSWRVVYNKETKVMYAVSCGCHNCGTFTLLVNSDGTPMLYDEPEN